MQSMHGNSLLYFLKYSFYMGVFVYMIFFSNNFIYAQNEFESTEENLNVTKSKSHEKKRGCRCIHHALHFQDRLEKCV